MDLATRYATLVTDHSRIVILLFVLATLVVGSAAADVDTGLSIASFESDSTAAQKQDYVESNFTLEGQNTTAVQVVVRGENVLRKDSLLETLRLQQRLRTNETVNGTLRARQPTVGFANLVALESMRAGSGGDGGSPPPGADAEDGAPGATEGGGTDPPAAAGAPTLTAQIQHLESRSPADVDATVQRLLDPDRAEQAESDPYSLLATSYEPGAAVASGRVMFVFQDVGDASADNLPEDVVQGQLAVRDIVSDALVDEAGFAFGAGIVDEEAGQATGESFAIISPVALLLIVAILLFAYRDLLDVSIGLLGIVLVLVWMGGFMGWAGIGVTQILIAVPFLLIGLSIDYALHVVMRYREADQDGRSDGDRPIPRAGMRRGLAGVVVAIGAATVTTSVGFLSNVVSPIVSIQEFGVVAAAGISSAFVVFGFFLPAIKVELEGLLRWIGFRREKSAFGRGGFAGRALNAAGSAARRAPVALLIIALLLSAGGAVAATDIETSIDQVDFLPRDSPDWMDSLPGAFQPSDYNLRDQAVYLNDEFVQARAQSSATLLIEGPVVDPGTLDSLSAGEEALFEQSTPIRLGSGKLETTGPIETILAVARENETVAATVTAADTDDDGVPEKNLTAVYDAVFDAAPDRASAVIHRANGEYLALRYEVGLQGGADTGTVTREMREVADVMAAGTALTVTATGQPVVQQVIQQGLLRTLVQGFLLTIGVILVFLTLIYWQRYDAPGLAPVVMLPVVCALAWILGTMYLANVPFNSETAIIASIAIGIGVDYAIHIGERFVEERSDTDDATAALERTVQGTGGALLASAFSTATGFGVLTLALVPSLRRFGFVTSVAIVYAFVASVVLLPGLLLLWDRRRGSEIAAEGAPAASASTAAEPGSPAE